MRLLESRSVKRDVIRMTNRENYRWESLDGLLIQVIPAEVKLGIVDSKSALGAV